MALIKKISNKNSKKSSFKPYEEENTLRPLKLFIITVRSNQANAIRKILDEYETSMTIFLSGEGVSFYTTFEMYNSSKKSVLLTIVREDKAAALKRRLEERFSVSKAASGTAAIINLTSVVGVTIYKFLSNTRKITKESKYGKRISK